MKEINYFDTPHSIRKGGRGMANLMKAVLKDREKEREAVKNFIPSEQKNEPTNNNTRV